MGLLDFLRKKRPEDTLRSAASQLELPSFPSVLLQARDMLRDPDSTVSEIGACIVQDPGASVRVLKTLNSAAFGLRRPVDSVEQAVALLGRAPLETILLAHGAGQALPRPRGGAFKERRFWYAAARRATVARAVALELHPATASQSFTAALLQDMAVPVLADVLVGRYDEVLRKWHGGEADLGELERAEFGWDHAEVGSWICEAWSFPAELTAAVAGHHAAPDDDDRTPVAVRAAALLPDVPAANDIDRVVSYLHDAHGLSSDRVVALLNEAEDDCGELARLFG